MRMIILIISVLLFASCGSNDHAGGSGVEIPNSMTMVALRSDGAPAKYARVRIVAEREWMSFVKAGASAVLDSMLTDESGTFSFRIPESDRVRIEIISNSEGTSVILDSTRTTLPLTPLGSVQAQWTPGATVMIAGTSFSQRADSNGLVLFTGIPSIHSALIGQGPDQNNVVLSAIFVRPLDTLHLGKLEAKRDSLILDDFEQRSSETLLEPFVHVSYWYSIADEHEGGRSTIYPSTANGNAWSMAITDSSAFASYSLSIHYHIDSSAIKYPYALFGCTLGNGINGGAIDSIVFMAYSDAKFTLTGGSHTLIYGEPATSIGWNRYSIHRTDLDSLGVSSNIQLLQFEFSDNSGSVFRLDDFVIYGDPFELLQVE